MHINNYCVTHTPCISKCFRSSTQFGCPFRNAKKKEEKYNIFTKIKTFKESEHSS